MGKSEHLVSSVIFCWGHTTVYSMDTWLRMEKISHEKISKGEKAVADKSLHL